MAEVFNAPVRRSIKGQIISVKFINKDDYKTGKFKHNCYIVNVDTLNEQPLSVIYITVEQFMKYGLKPIVFEGNVVNFTVEDNIAGETGYLDVDTGEFIYHTTSFTSFVGCENVGTLGLIGVFGSVGVGPAIVESFIATIEAQRRQQENLCRKAVVTEETTIGEEPTTEEKPEKTKKS